MTFPLALVVAALAAAVPRVVTAIDQSQVIYALNAGAPGVYVDSQGIYYEKDYNSVGTVAFANRQPITGIREQDGIFYATERYHTGDFSYNITFRSDEGVPDDVLTDGEYAVVLKFAETYWQEPGRKVFHVHINDIPAISELDIYAKAGYYRAYDEIVPIKISGNRTALEVNGQEGSFNGTLNLSFKKIEGKDNPKICAFYIGKGSLAELNITLPGHFGEDEVREPPAAEPIAAEAAADNATHLRFEGIHGKSLWQGHPSGDDAEGLAEEHVVIPRRYLVGAFAALGAGLIILGRPRSRSQASRAKKS